MKIKLLVILVLSFFSFLSQENTDPGTISGNIQTIGQYYQEDSLINAALPDQLFGFNGFANINYQKNNFRAGIRYESYLNPLEGYPTTFNGTGLGYRYMSWAGEGISVTIGNFYDQFGSGMIFRAYEERQLGIDNALHISFENLSPIPKIYVSPTYTNLF